MTGGAETGPDDATAGRWINGRPSVARLQNGAIVKQNYYDAAGHMIVEANGSGTWLRAEIYAGGRHLATWANNATFFSHADWLGTERARTNSSGVLCETITSLPFGDGEVTNGSCTPTPTFFTGLERDAESDLDPTDFRMYTSQYGRWLSPDPLAGDITNPQSLNRYAYVLNNPTTLNDRLGLDSTDPSKCNAGNNYCKGTTHTTVCYGMVCADQYYGGSFFEGFNSISQPICVKNGKAGYCSQDPLNSFWANGSDEFDVNNPSSGVYWTAPPGSAATNSSGRTSTSTGSLGFSDQVWTWVRDTADFPGFKASGTDQAQTNPPPTWQQELIDIMEGNYSYLPNFSATSQSPNAVPSALVQVPLWPSQPDLGNVWQWVPLPGFGK